MTSYIHRLFQKVRAKVLSVMAEGGPPAAKNPKEGDSGATPTSCMAVSKLKKCIILMSYCGKNYMGMQKNPGVPTIEEELMKALAKSHVIPPDFDYGRLHFQRCSRTDKGVSAARQIVSLKISPSRLTMAYEPRLIPAINENLPQDIKVMGMKRVTGSFNSKNACTSRVYEYLLPTYTFAPLEDTNLRFRIDATLITRIQNILNLYVGTHNFHNFTSGVKFYDSSAKRYVMSFNVGHPFVKNDVEFVVLSVEGQSFMMHQIRKMIGLLIAIVRGHFSDVDGNVLKGAYNRDKLDIPKAPALGLLLDNIRFLNYNRKYGNDGLHETLEWDEYEDAVSAFKSEYIHSHIIDTELREYTMLRWLETLQKHDFYHWTTLNRQQLYSQTTHPSEEVVTEPSQDTISTADGSGCDQTESHEHDTISKEHDTVSSEHDTVSSEHDSEDDTASSEEIRVGK